MSKKVMTLAIFLSLIAGGGIASLLFPIETGEIPYICKDTQQICIGVRLSSTNKTCYYMENGTERMKRCLVEPYWYEYYNEEIIVNPPIIYEVGKGQNVCDPKRCVPIE